MKRTITTLAIAAACLFAGTAQADLVTFHDSGSEPAAGASLLGETIYRTEFIEKKSKKQIRVAPWEIRTVTFDKRLGSKQADLRKIQIRWNEILGKYAKNSFNNRALSSIEALFATKREVEVDKKKVMKDVKPLKELEDISNGLAPSAWVWAHAAKIRFYAKHGGIDKAGLDAFNSAIMEWEKAVKKYSSYLDTKKKFARTSQNIGGEGHPFRTMRSSRVHASVMFAWDDIATYYMRAKKFDLAWKKGGLPISSVSRRLFIETQNKGFLVEWGIPQTDSIATRISNMAKVASDKDAEAIWRGAASAFEAMVDLGGSMDDKEAIGRAELSLADARIWIGDQRSRARDKFNTYVDKLDKVIDNGAKGAAAKTFGGESASVLALAFNGLGKIAYVEKKYAVALRYLARSTANFSANKEARAEAVLYSGLCYARMAKGKDLKPAAKKYLLKMADTMMVELRATLSSTEVYGRRKLLAAAIAEASPKE